MENVHTAGRVPYRVALPIKPLSFIKLLDLLYGVFIDAGLVIILFVKYLLKSLKDVIIFREITNLSGQTALVTGGAHGIGRSIAIALSKKGCNIIIADIDGLAAKKLSEDLCKSGVIAIGYEVDVADYNQVISLRKKLDENGVHVDILINNAGLMPLVSLREGTKEDIERIVATVREFLSAMILRKRGHILQISSMSALHPMGGAIVYSATKFAVTGFMQALEQELRQEGLENKIRYTTVYPYFVATRYDLMKAVNLRFPAISAEKTADMVIYALQHNIRAISVPWYDKPLINFLNMLPFALQCLVRDYILKEKESKMFT